MKIKEKTNFIAIVIDRNLLVGLTAPVTVGVHHESRPFPLERPKRPDKNLSALCRATQLTKEELKKFYRAFKQVYMHATHYVYVTNSWRDALSRLSL